VRGGPAVECAGEGTATDTGVGSRHRQALALALLGALLGAAPAGAARRELALGEAVATALAGHPSLAEAEGAEHAAWAAVDLAGSARWPQLRLDGRYTHLGEVPATALPGLPPIELADPDTWVATATVEQLLWSGGRVAAGAEAADREARAAGEARRRARQLVAFGAERAFRLLVAAQRQVAAAGLDLAAAEAHLRDAQSRLEARAAPRFDVLRAEVGVAEAQQGSIAAESARETAHAALLQALGLAEGDFVAVEPERPDAAAPLPEIEELLGASRLARPELAALRLRVEAAEARVRAARAERLPRLGLAADYQYARPESPTLLTRWSAGIFVSVPLLDGGRAGALRGQAEADALRAGAALESGRRRVEAEVRQAFARLAAAAARVETAGRRLEQAAELARLADVRYRGGVGTATEVADAQASLARARSGLTAASAERGVAAAELALAVGEGGDDAPAKEGAR